MRGFFLAAALLTVLLASVSLFSGLVEAQYSCGSPSNPAGVCQTGSCPVGTKCELAANCTSACLGAGATSCYVCVNPIEVDICRAIGTIEQVLGALALLFFVLGGILFAWAHLLSSAGNQRGNAHGLAVGLIIAAVIMLVLYLIAPYIVVAMAQFGNLPIAQYPNVCEGISF